MPRMIFTFNATETMIHGYLIIEAIVKDEGNSKCYGTWKFSLHEAGEKGMRRDNKLAYNQRRRMSLMTRRRSSNQKSSVTLLNLRWLKQWCIVNRARGSSNQNHWETASFFTWKNRKGHIPRTREPRKKRIRLNPLALLGYDLVTGTLAQRYTGAIVINKIRGKVDLW